MDLTRYQQNADSTRFDRIKHLWDANFELRGIKIWEAIIGPSHVRPPKVELR